MKKIIISIFALALTNLSAPMTAQAGDEYFQEYEYFEQHSYEDELQHCIDILRPNLGLTGSSYEKVSYEVTDINFRSPWYRFEIVATVFDQAGDTKLDGFRVACKANRRINSAKLFERKNDISDYRTLIVRNTSELTQLQSNSVQSNSALAQNISAK